MVSSTLAKYANLVRNISNWHLYFSRKFKVPYEKLLFRIRGKGIFFSTPAKSLYLVFKEIFLNDVYGMDQLAASLPEKPGTPAATVTLHLETADGNAVTASVYDDFTKDNTYIAEVPCISLTEILTSNQLSKVHPVKVDCEGSEYPIIYETPPHVWENIDRMAIEVHQPDNEKRNMSCLEKYLITLGYTLKNYELDNGCNMLFAARHA